ncbi:hypothetical protein BH09PSE5_BH09PSE5_41270 [soil metagenome]
MAGVLVGAFLVLALGFGAMASFVGGLLAVALLLALTPIPFIFVNYRVGVVCLTVALPFAASKLLPQVQGLNIFTYLLLATAASFAFQSFKNRNVVGIPGTVLWAYLLPVTIGIIVALPHVSEGARNYGTEAAIYRYAPMEYFKSAYLKPVAYFMGYAVLLANAIKTSKEPEKFLAALSISAILPAFVVMFKVATYTHGLSSLMSDREFLTPTGYHANEYGLLFSLAVGPLLYSSGRVEHRGYRLLARIGLGIVTLGLILTFSRGAFLSLIIIAAMYLWHRKQIKVAVGIVLVAALMSVGMPDAVKERFGTGLREGSIGDAGNIEKDELTAGRFVGWELLAPEVLRSPIWGRGIGSTAWSDPVAKGQFKPDHPHNMFLEALMDLGFAGFFALAYAFNRFLNRYKHLGRQETLSPLLRDYFWGARASLLGTLVMAFTTGYYMPNSAQTPLWFSLGFLFCYWSYGRVTATAANPVKLGSAEAVRAALTNHRAGRFLRG